MSPGPYAYLLGLYLGDGCLSLHPRAVYRLRIALDSAYPQIIEECQTAIQRVLPFNRVGVQQKRGENCFDVWCYSRHLRCLFPQHGKGPKHLRPISLAPWQKAMTHAHPDRFLRGLIHSDGCRFDNVVQARGRTYRYPRYTFSNTSADIRRLFCDACDRAGVEWRQMNARNIAVSRRASVEILDRFIGPKA